MVFERPPRPKKATARPNPTQRPKKTNGRGGGNRGNKNGNGSGDNRPQEPSPWLIPEDEPEPHNSASFIEYLRWMRSPDHPQKDGTKLQIMQMTEESANYNKRLSQLIQRTKLIAGKDNCFQVTSSWRIRVGGHRGPENILLPAFDPLGIPYIPSSTLRGVARTQAIREFLKQQKTKSKDEKKQWKEAEKQIEPWFGSLDATEKSNYRGKVIFLDAYPLPNQVGLEMDMANNIWTWENDDLKYSPNPNPFFSLKEPTFLIGLKLATNCDNPKILERVKQWLIDGLKAGTGSQVNSGYGELILPSGSQSSDEFFRVEFSLEGQLIHGRQKFTQWNWNERRKDWQMRGQAEAEVRPIAFKSMLRYWFRAFSLGVLEPSKVQEWEAKLFGGINPQSLGWVRVNIRDGQLIQREPRPNFSGKNDDCGEQAGILILSHSPEAPSDQRKHVQKLFESLTWLMFNLGGIGQGARRPCYSRRNRDSAPWYRGSTFYIDSGKKLWEHPDSLEGFQEKFQEKLKQFYQSLSVLTENKISPKKLLNSGQVRRDQWIEAVDSNCQIIVCSGKEVFGKPYALAILHSQDLKVEDRRGNLNYDGNLCGRVLGDVKPSPVWIADLGDYQLVTVFGVTDNPRQEYMKKLRAKTSRRNYITLFPLP